MKEDRMKYVTYVCTQCQKEDTNKYFADEPIWHFTTCWSCGAGRGKGVEYMAQSEIGMFPRLDAPQRELTH